MSTEEKENEYLKIDLLTLGQANVGGNGRVYLDGPSFRQEVERFNAGGGRFGEWGSPRLDFNNGAKLSNDLMRHSEIVDSNVCVHIKDLYLVEDDKGTHVAGWIRPAGPLASQFINSFNDGEVKFGIRCLVENNSNNSNEAEICRIVTWDVIPDITEQPVLGLGTVQGKQTPVVEMSWTERYPKPFPGEGRYQRHYDVQVVALNSSETITGHTYLDNGLTMDQELEKLNATGVWGRMGFPNIEESQINGLAYLQMSKPVLPEEASHRFTDLRVERDGDRKAIMGTVTFCDPAAERLFVEGYATFGLRSLTLVNGKNSAGKEERIINKIVSIDLIEGHRDEESRVLKDYDLLYLNEPDLSGNIYVNTGTVIDELLAPINATGGLELTWKFDNNPQHVRATNLRLDMKGSPVIKCDLDLCGSNYLLGLARESLLLFTLNVDTVQHFVNRDGSKTYMHITRIGGLHVEENARLK